ncbi:MAG: hypothetical protein KF721_09935 [Ignavibacteriaceae bacterium]|nr:hypothetical protein [Ignavibacteriaceae bacterium]
MKKTVTAAELKNVLIYDTPERMEVAGLLDKRIKKGLLDLIIALKEIYDNEYFRELGYDTMQGYCLNRLEISYRTAMSYIRISNRFELSASVLEENLHHDATASSKNVPIHQKLLSLDTNKLDILCQLPDERINEIKNTGALTLKGKQYSIEDLESMKRHEVRNRVNDFLGIKREKPKTVRPGINDYLYASMKNLETTINIWIKSQPGGVVDDEIENDLGSKLNALLDSIDRHIFPIKSRVRNEERLEKNPYKV